MTRMRIQLLILLLVIILFAGTYILVKNAIMKDVGELPGNTQPEEEHVHEINTRKTQKKDLEGYDRATCVNAGFYKEVYYCDCGEKMGEERKSEPALGHSMTENGKGNECTRCGLLVDSQGLKFELVDGLYYAVTGMGSCKDKNVVIPAEQDGVPVRAIAKEVFLGKSSIVSVKIPDSVAIIGDKAFNNCTGLKKVSLGNSVTSFGEEVFGGCNELAYNQYDNANYLGNDINPYVVLVSAKSGDILSCEINADTKVIAPMAFADCALVHEIRIPSRVKIIGAKAFYNCTGLLGFTLGESVVEVGDKAFMYCHRLIEVYDLSPEITVTQGDIGYGYLGHYAKDVYTSSDAQSKLVNKDGFVFYENGIERYLMAYDGDNPVVTLPTDNNYEVYSHAFSGLEITDITVVEGITAIGNYAFKNCKLLTTVILPDSLTAISEGAFEGCEVITSISIPKNVISVGNHAFKGCKALEQITIPEGVSTINDYCFMECVALEKITLEGSITSVGDHAFDGCKKLSAFNFNSVISVGDYAFNGCAAITEINLKNVQTIGDFAFSNVGVKSLTIPTATTSVGAHAFAGCESLNSLTVSAGRGAVLTFGAFAFEDCTALTSVSVGNKVTKIADSMFSGCTSLASITLGADVSAVGNRAFYNCDDLVKVKITGIKSIGDCAFMGCTRLGSVEFGTKLTTIGDGAFSECYNLTSISIPSGVTSIGDDAFLNCFKLCEVYIANRKEGMNIEGSRLTEYALNVRYQSDDAVRIYQYDGFVFYLGEVNYLLGYIGDEVNLVLPESVNGKAYEIYNHAFFRHEDLQSVDFGNALVTNVGDNAFADCTSLSQVTLSKNVKTIGSYVFLNCENLTTLVIPEGSELTSVGSYAFSGCDLSGVAFGDKLTTVGDYAFKGNENLVKVSFAGPVSYIGDYAFAGCGVSELTIAGGKNGVIGISAFEKTDIAAIVIPEGFVSVKANAFKDCAEVTSVSIPASLIEIGKDAFLATSPDSIDVAAGNQVYTSNSGCLVETHSFTVVLGSNFATIPSTAKIIGSGAFKGCSLLTEIDLSGVIRINDGAFAECHGLESVVLGNNLVSLGSEAFMKCIKLASINIPGSLSVISASAFEKCSALESVVINPGVQLIDKAAFKDCGIASLVIGEGVTEIGNNAFENCDSLETVNIPEGVVLIGEGAFVNCNGITTVVIGQGTTKILANAFNGCDKLTTITLPCTLTEVGANAFIGCNGVKTIIFDGTRNQYNAIAIDKTNSIFENKSVNVVITK